MFKTSMMASSSSTRRRFGHHDNSRQRQSSTIPLILLVALSYVSSPTTKITTYAQQQPDYTCEFATDTSCPSLRNGVCSNQASDSPIPACEFGDCIDCQEQCTQFHQDCNGCLNAIGCYYCPADGTCYNSNRYEWRDQTSGCAGPTNYLTEPTQSCSRPDAFYNDPLYDAQRWMIDMIDLLPVWRDFGLRGEGIKIRINDDGVDMESNNIDLVPNFDLANSCPDGGHLPNPTDRDGHGTRVAGIAAGVADNNHCAMGVANMATFSSCNWFRNGATYGDLSLGAAEGGFDVSQSSFGLYACGSSGGDGERKNLRSRNLQAACPFIPALSDASPCNSCAPLFNGQVSEPSQDCERAIIEHCKAAFEDDPGCSDFLDLIIGGECNYDKLPASALTALAEGIQEGRQGKGVIYVISSGNGYKRGDDVNFGGLTNSRFAISVGAVGKNGLHASYSTPGAALFVAAPGGDSEDISKLMTTAYGTGGCTDSGQGTSFAAPVVSGVAALLLEANPDLTWRDVQWILAQSSKRVENDPDDDTANENAAGIWHSNYYGFGIINANAAVELATNDWQLVEKESMILVESGTDIDVPIQDAGSGTASTTLTVGDEYADFVTESVVVFLNLEHFSRGDLQVVLTSPSDTRSILHPGKRPENQQTERWKLTTVRNWGETPNGVWSLEIIDQKEGDVADCADAAFFARLNGRAVDCDDAAKDGYCANGSVIVDASLLDNSEFLGLVDNDKTIVEACCVCGGGLDTNDVTDVLKDWKIQLYGQGEGSPEGEDVEVPAPAPVADEVVIPEPESTPEPTESTVGNDGGSPVMAPSAADPDAPVTSPTVGGAGGDIGDAPFASPVGGTNTPGPSPVGTPEPTEVSIESPGTDGTGGGETPEPVPGNNSTTPEPALPPDVTNDRGRSCAAALELTERGAPTSGTFISDGDVSGLRGSCMQFEGRSITSLGNFYKVDGNGNIMTATVCLPNTATDAGASVFTGRDCSQLVCTPRQTEQASMMACPGFGSGYTVSWLSEAEQTYYLLVSQLPVAVSSQSGRRTLQSSGTNSYELTLTETPPSTNQDCSSATPYTGSTVVGNTVGSSDGTNCDGKEASGIWYVLEDGTMGGASHVFEAETCMDETNFNNSISVYRGGSCGDLECVAVDYLACQNGMYGQSVYWTAESDEKHYLFVHADKNIEEGDHDAGSFALEVKAAPQQANDACDAALAMTVGGETVRGSTAGVMPDTASHNFVTSCGMGGAGVWYKVVGTGDMLQATTCHEDTDHSTSIFVFAGTCQSLNCLSAEAGNFAACINGPTDSSDTATINFQTETDKEYYILVASADGTPGTFELGVTKVTGAPENDVCSRAVALTLDDTSVQTSTLSASASDFPYGEYCGTPLETAGVWYTLEGTGGGISVSTCSENNYDTAISVFTGRCSDHRCVTGTSSQDPLCDSSGVTAAWLTEEGVTYHILVHGSRSNSMGTAVLSVSPFEVIEPNEFCPEALAAPTDGTRIQGSTEDAVHAATTATFCGVDIENPGLWYTFEGNGDVLDFAACTEDNDGTFDVAVSVFSSPKGSRGGCGDLTCVTGLLFSDQRCVTATSSSRRSLQIENGDSTIILATDEQLQYHVFVHGTDPSGSGVNGGVGDFELYIAQHQGISGANTGGGDNGGDEIPADLPRGIDMFRWTPMETPISISFADSNSVSLLTQPSDGGAEVSGRTLTYTPRSNFEGIDAFYLRVCSSSSEGTASSGETGTGFGTIGAVGGGGAEECYAVQVTIRVAGTQEEADQARAAQESNGDDDGWNKLWLLLLLLLLPCLCCCLWYLFCRGDDDDDENNKRDTTQDNDDGMFEDEPEEHNELVKYEPPQDSGSSEDEDEDQDEEEDSGEDEEEDEEDWESSDGEEKDGRFA